MVRKKISYGRQSISKEDIDAVIDVLKSDFLTQGPLVSQFEEQICGYTGAKFCVALSSGTAALHLAVKALNIEKNMEGITSPNTFVASANCMAYCHVNPKFSDIDAKTYCIDPQKLETNIGPKTRLVIPVHFSGLPCDMEKIHEICKKNKLYVIEDAAHALGASFPNGMAVGSSGNFTCFSFYANKNLSTGEGGAIAVNDEKTYCKLQALSRQGLSIDAWKRFTHPQAALTPGVVELGYKMNFMDLLACIGRVQLKRQTEFHVIRKELADFYIEQMLSVPVEIGFQAGLSDTSHARHLFVVTLPIEQLNCTRNDVILALRERNVGASIHYAPLHTMPFFKDTKRTDMTNTNYLGDRIMTLPISASMSLEDAQYVVDEFKRIIEQKVIR